MISDREIRAAVEAAEKRALAEIEAIRAFGLQNTGNRFSPATMALTNISTRAQLAHKAVWNAEHDRDGHRRRQGQR